MCYFIVLMALALIYNVENNVKRFNGILACFDASIFIITLSRPHCSISNITVGLAFVLTYNYVYAVNMWRFCSGSKLFTMLSVRTSTCFKIVLGLTFSFFIVKSDYLLFTR